MTPPTFTAGILVGGRSRRMGRPKALIEIDGATLLERTVAIARRAAGDAVLVGAPPFELPPALAALACIDDCPAGVGPIGGLAGLLSARPGRWCLLVACDMPGLNEALLTAMMARADSAACDAVVPLTPSPVGHARLHPCCAAYDSSILGAVQARIRARRHGMVDLLSTLRTDLFELDAAQAAMLENWNAPADLPPARPGG